jgi:hypothetical protein
LPLDGLEWRTFFGSVASMLFNHQLFLLSEVHLPPETAGIAVSPERVAGPTSA